jgi:hypothetical protein
MEGEGASQLATAGERHGPGSGAKPRGRGSSQRISTCVEERWRLDGEGATVAVMRCGCSRGDFFEGCEGRLRERSHAGSGGVVVFGRRHTRGSSGTETQRTPSGTGMQQARDLECGVNRRGGEKPRGRNAQAGWHRSAEGGGNVTGSGRTRGLPDEGHTRTNPTRGESLKREQLRRRISGLFRPALKMMRRS